MIFYNTRIKIAISIQNSVATLNYNPSGIYHKLRIPREKQYRITYKVVPRSCI